MDRFVFDVGKKRTYYEQMVILIRFKERNRMLLWEEFNEFKERSTSIARTEQKRARFVRFVDGFRSREQNKKRVVNESNVLHQATHVRRTVCTVNNSGEQNRTALFVC